MKWPDAKHLSPCSEKTSSSWFNKKSPDTTFVSRLAPKLLNRSARNVVWSAIDAPTRNTNRKHPNKLLIKTWPQLFPSGGEHLGRPTYLYPSWFSFRPQTIHDKSGIFLPTCVAKLFAFPHTKTA